MRLKTWPTDRLKRRQIALRHEPLALTETVGTRQTVTVACDIARKQNVRPGMDLAEARALCRGLVDRPHDDRADQQSLVALGRWMTRFTPAVAVEHPHGLFLDVGGCERLFGGLDRLLREVIDSIDGLGIAAAAMIAPTAGAAWALASSGKTGGIVTEPEVLPALLPLAPATLRLSRPIASALHKLGVETIGQLIRLPRSALPVRFGDELLRRVDQALGRTAEPLVTLPYRTPIKAEIKFEAAIDSIETVWAVFRHLLRSVVDDLARRGCGAQQLHVRFDRDRAAPIEKTIFLSRPNRDEANLCNLLRCALETVLTRQGFMGVVLSVPVFDRLTEDQSLITGQDEHDAEADYDQLLERLHARLGGSGVQRAQLVASHLPERACRYVSALRDKSPRKPVKVLAEPDPDLQRPSASRPLRLLEMPQEVEMSVTPDQDSEGKPFQFHHLGRHHLVRYAIGPERIAGVWWEGHNKTRDYYEIEDHDGECFWAFRVMNEMLKSRWFIHGKFA